MGALAVGPAANRPSDELRRLLAGFKPAFFICQDQEQVDKALEIGQEIGRPSGRSSTGRGRGSKNYRHPELIWLEDTGPPGDGTRAGAPGRL